MIDLIAPRPSIARLRTLPARGTKRRDFAQRAFHIIFASAEGGRAQAFPPFAFLGANYPI